MNTGPIVDQGLRQRFIVDGPYESRTLVAITLVPIYVSLMTLRGGTQVARLASSRACERCTVDTSRERTRRDHFDYFQRLPLAFLK